MQLPPMTERDRAVLKAFLVGVVLAVLFGALPVLAACGESWPGMSAVFLVLPGLLLTAAGLDKGFYAGDCIPLMVVVTLVDVIIFAGIGIAITLFRSAVLKQHGEGWLAIAMAALVFGMFFIGYQIAFGTMLGDW